MNNQDLNNIKIKDTKYYNPSSGYTRILKSRNLVTVDQLIGDNFNKEMLKGFNSKMIFQFKGFIAMIKYRYADQPLYFDYLLDEYIDFEGSENGIIHLIKNNGIEQCIYLDELFGCPIEKINPLFQQYKNRIYGEILKGKNNIKEDKVRVIDFIRWISTINNNSRYKYIYQYALTYIESYEKNRGYISENQKISVLKEQLNILKKIKEDVDTGINNADEQVEIRK